MSARSPASFEFTPTNVPPDLLDTRTVGRTELLERIDARIRTAATGGGKAHTLVVGARGSGKTHVLTVAAHRAASAPELADALSIVSLTEDAEGVVSYADLLFTMIERALREDDATSAVADAGAMLAAARASRRDSDALELLVRELAGPRTVLLVIENLDRIFGDIGLAGQRSLRAFVETWRRLVILASTPLLFPGVSDREQPWYGSFVPEHLGDVEVEQGTQLLIGLARERGDDELAAFLAGVRARQRLRAVADIAGGSPRMWVMLNGCLSAELLDELLPLIERLLENLVPYYQARLGELPGNERKLVIELARTSVVDSHGTVVYRSQGARTVSDLAQACGMDRNVASISLRRLADARWVRTLRVAGTDGRTSWYELREPLFRHHLQHRETGGGTLAVVVTLLKAWHSFPERISLLGASPGGSAAELHLLASLDAPAVSDSGYARGDPDELLGEARRWDGQTTALGPISRAVADAAVSGARSREPDGERWTAHLPADRRASAARLAVAAHRAARTQADDEERRRVLAGLLAAREAAAGADPGAEAELALLAGGWAGACGEAREAVSCMSDVRGSGGSRLALAIEAELAYYLWATGTQRGYDVAVAALADRRERFGDDDPDTLTSRQNVASMAGMLGERALARDESRAVAEICGRVLGVEHPRTLASRHSAAFYAGMLGEHALARDDLRAVAEVHGRVLGIEHPDTLSSRHEAAFFAGQLGEHQVARDESRAVAEARGRVLGVEDPATLISRHNAAYCTGLLGEHETARIELRAVAEILARVLGPRHPRTLTARENAARELALAGSEAAAVRELVEIMDGSGDGEADSVSSVMSSLGDVLAIIREPQLAREVLTALAGLGADRTIDAFARASAARSGGADHGGWLTVWGRALEQRAELDLLSRLFAAAGELLSDRPAMAQAMPEEERRLAYRMAGHMEPPAAPAARASRRRAD